MITNDITKEYSAVTIAQLEAMIGIDALLGIAPKLRESGMSLPGPKSTRSSKRKEPMESEFNLRELSRNLLEAIERMFRR